MKKALESPKSESTRPKIIIIEDDRSINNLIVGAINLEMEEIDAFHFRNAREAIHELWEKDYSSKFKVDAIFIDIHLDDNTSGIDVLEYCQFVAEEIPIILMSSHFTDQQLDEISKLNTPPVLLRKPFGAEEIIQLSKWIFNFNRGG